MSARDELMKAMAQAIDDVLSLIPDHHKDQPAAAIVLYYPSRKAEDAMLVSTEHEDRVFEVMIDMATMDSYTGTASRTNVKMDSIITKRSLQ